MRLDQFIVMIIFFILNIVGIFQIKSTQARIEKELKEIKNKMK